ncbi:MAG: GMP/IMP nucleotidase [Gammaproteobacteria bacterium]|nr:GMP/IMP nucleotidase [Gammaproteobacteria bacterium]
MINWAQINTVFLDMDGTLLDLNFDTYFWRKHLPQRYAEKHSLTLTEAQEQLFPRFLSVEGTINWYCLDYWTRELALDIPLLKQEVKHLIDVHPHVTEFLQALREQGKHVVLVTNAHMKSLELKMEQTQLAGHLDTIICAHDFGQPKEAQAFWQQLQHKLPFSTEHTLLIDDSLPVLRSARQYGIGHLLAVQKPDSQAPRKDVEEFEAISSFLEIMPV